MRLEHLIAQNMARLRAQRDWSQAELASRMAAVGFTTWNTGRVSSLETYRRPISLLEATALCGVFELPLGAFLAGSEGVDLPNGDVLDVELLRLALLGEVNLAADPIVREERDLIRRTARRFNAEPAVIHETAINRYGRSLVEERDARAETINGSTLAVRRAMAMKEIARELEQVFG